MSSPVPVQDQQQSQVSAAPPRSSLTVIARALSVFLFVGFVLTLFGVAFYSIGAIVAFRAGGSERALMEKALPNLLEGWVLTLLTGWLARWLWRWGRKPKPTGEAARQAESVGTEVPTPQPTPRGIGKKTQWSSCNVLSVK